MCCSVAVELVRQGTPVGRPGRRGWRFRGTVPGRPLECSSCMISNLGGNAARLQRTLRGASGIMSSKPIPPFLLALLLAACSSPATTSSPSSSARSNAPSSETRTATDAKPDVPAGAAAKRDTELAARAAGFVDAFTNSAAAFTRDGKQVVFLSNRDGLPQLYLAGRPDEPAVRLLATDQRVSNVTPTADGKDVLFMSDIGADEHWSFFRVGLDGQRLVELTPGVRLNRDEFLVPDGTPDTLFFSARKMSEARSTVYSASATAASEPKAIYSDEKPAFLVDVSADGASALVVQYPSRSENYLLRIDVASGQVQRLFPSQGKVAIEDAKFSRDGERVFVATDNGGEQALMLALDAETGNKLAEHAIAPPTSSFQ